eukprot:CCRYP_016767-RB/>CCRYP_016767-RB protein AED:0.22 eAED:0.51 QI:0/0/0/1/0/0.5/2/0/160
MLPTLPITDRWDTRRWCRYGYPLDPLENSPWSTVSCLMRMGCNLINLEAGVGSIGIWWVFPGGKDSMYAKLLLEASVKMGDKLDFAVGKGNDGDVPKVSFIMDSREFPFFVVEQYHQIHDGFKWGEDYPQSYNLLMSKFAKTEDFGSCPNGLVGIGIGGL